MQQIEILREFELKVSEAIVELSLVGQFDEGKAVLRDVDVEKYAQQIRDSLVCEWKYLDYEEYETNCGNRYSTEDGLVESSYKFCPGCAGTIKEVGSE